MRILTAFALFVAVVAGLCGCSGTQSRWQVGFRPAENAPIAAQSPKTRLQWANYAPLAEGKILDGYALLGTTQFRDEPLDEREFVKGSALESFAKSIGADMVLLGRQPAGLEKRVRYIRTVAPGRSADPGDPTAGGSTVESIPYETEVPVVDYIAVFLRLARPIAD